MKVKLGPGFIDCCHAVGLAAPVGLALASAGSAALPVHFAQPVVGRYGEDWQVY